MKKIMMANTLKILIVYLCLVDRINFYLPIFKVFKDENKNNESFIEQMQIIETTCKRHRIYIIPFIQYFTFSFYDWYFKFWNIQSEKDTYRYQLYLNFLIFWDLIYFLILLYVILQENKKLTYFLFFDSILKIISEYVLTYIFSSEFSTNVKLMFSYIIQNLFLLVKSLAIFLTADCHLIINFISIAVFLCLAFLFESNTDSNKTVSEEIQITEMETETIISKSRGISCNKIENRFRSKSQNSKTSKNHFTSLPNF
jgi:hypothetical protein